MQPLARLIQEVAEDRNELPSTPALRLFRVPVVVDDVIPFVRAGATDNGYYLLRGAHIEHFMRYAGLDEDEVARLVFDHLAAATPPGGIVATFIESALALTFLADRPVL
jgi:hypothetical protein